MGWNLGMVGLADDYQEPKASSPIKNWTFVVFFCDENQSIDECSGHAIQINKFSEYKKIECSYTFHSI